MKSKEEFLAIKNQSDKELLLLIQKEYEKLRELKFKAKLRELKNVNEIKRKKKRIAQILTILRQNIEKDMESSDAKKAKR